MVLVRHHLYMYIAHIRGKPIRKYIYLYPIIYIYASFAARAPVDEQAIHGLSCIRSAGRQSRHAAINDAVKRALSSAQIPAMLEPTSLSRSDGKRPDGATIAPWKSGRMLVWDVSCTDTFALSRLAQGVTEA